MINNGAVHVVFTMIYNAISSAAKAKITALHINAKYSVLVLNMLEKMGHPQTEKLL